MICFSPEKLSWSMGDGKEGGMGFHSPTHISLNLKIICLLAITKSCYWFEAINLPRCWKKKKRRNTIVVMRLL